ncbi:hypothetical protein [Roseovarius sp. MBR-6]|jgi:hypothetical protein|uniref:hypothetical protein n=1 Tax=Roseovarius sp. MBR-6 TaxID=3156459 RepID=UPI0033956856
MSDYKEARIAPLIRAHVLRFLEGRKDHESTADILVTVINGTRDGLSVYYSDVVEELRWLERNGHLTLQGGDFLIVTATDRGLRIARDEDRDAGIAYPSMIKGA